jgi:hypothetical protein
MSQEQAKFLKKKTSVVLALWPSKTWLDAELDRLDEVDAAMKLVKPDGFKPSAGHCVNSACSGKHKISLNQYTFGYPTGKCAACGKDWEHGQPSHPGQFLATLESLNNINNIARAREATKKYYLKYMAWGPPDFTKENMEGHLDTLAHLSQAKYMLRGHKTGPKRNPTLARRRRIMERLLRYETHYSSGKEGHPMRSA